MVKRRFRSRIQVTFADGTRSSATITAAEPENDIAVLQPVQLPGLLLPAVMGNPNAMQVGDEAFVVGNPYGLYSSMSAGVISGFERTFKAHGSDNEMTQLEADVRASGRIAYRRDYRHGHPPGAG